MPIGSDLLRKNLEKEAIRDIGTINARIRKRIEREVKEHAIARAEYKRRMISEKKELRKRKNQYIENVYDNDPGCKTCGKKKAKK